MKLAREGIRLQRPKKLAQRLRYSGATVSSLSFQIFHEYIFSAPLRSVSPEQRACQTDSRPTLHLHREFRPHVPEARCEAAAFSVDAAGKVGVPQELHNLREIDFALSEWNKPAHDLFTISFRGGVRVPIAQVNSNDARAILVTNLERIQSARRDVTDVRNQVKVFWVGSVHYGP